jgi:hypothetical protein
VKLINTSKSNRRSTIKKLSALTAVAVVVSQISSCAAISTAIHHGSLTTESKMSKTIFLDPVPANEKTIYVQVKDTSGKDVKLKDALVAQLQGQGWDVVHDVSKAHDMVQVNVLQVGKADSVQSVWQSMNSGFGNALMGGLAGVAAGLAANSAGVGLGVGAGVGAIGWMADEMYQDVVYSMITDIQVSVKVNGEVTQTTQADLDQGSQTKTMQTYNQKTNWMRYRTRIASVADKANLDFDEAKPVLIDGITKQIAGIFAG